MFLQDRKILVPVWPQRTGVPEPSTIGELAYDFGNEERVYTVYIEENEMLAPFLVLTDGYNGRALLVREETLPIGEVRFNNFSGFYENSEMDEFLNNEYFATLAPAVQAIIPDTTITIAARSAILSTSRDLMDIVRKVFLLSYTEISTSMPVGVPGEGKSLKYFSTTESHITYCKGEPRTWWLRTTSVGAGDDMVQVVSYRGFISSSQALYGLDVRPIFCLSQAIPVKQVMSGDAQIYVIDFESMEGWEPDYIDPAYEEPQRYMVEVFYDSTDHGGVNGSGLRQAGNEAEVEAWETIGVIFQGWYEDGQLVSTEKEYRFEVDRAVKLGARFTRDEGTYLFKTIASDGGSFSQGRHEYLYPSNSDSIVAIPNPGYRFVVWHSSNGGSFIEPENPSTRFVMPDNDVEIYAEFEKIE
jgi:hypothetical protein